MSKIILLVILFVSICTPVLAEYSVTINTGGYINTSIRYNNYYRCVNKNQINIYQRNYNNLHRYNRIVHRQQGRRYVNDNTRGKIVVVVPVTYRYYNN